MVHLKFNIVPRCNSDELKLILKKRYAKKYNLKTILTYRQTYYIVGKFLYKVAHIVGVMVCMLTSNARDRGFESWSGQTKDYKIGICCFSTKHTELRRKSKDWLAWNQNNVSEWNNMYTYCFSELALIKSNSACWSSTKGISLSSHQNVTCSHVEHFLDYQTFLSHLYVAF